MGPEPTGGPPKDLPRIIGAYRVLGEFGRGRLGPVLLARHRASGRELALRVVRPEWACLPVYVSRLVRGAHAAAQIRHANLAAVVDLGEVQGRVHFASELVSGVTFHKKVATNGAFVAREAVALVLQAARGLQAAHGQGITHGDVSPRTLFLDDDGRVRLADLGLTATPATVAAEEVREKSGPIALATANETGLDPDRLRADIRGLGSTLVFLLTGQPAKADPTALIGKGMPMNLVELVRSLTDSRPGSAITDVGQAIAGLERFLNARGVGGTAPREEDATILNECIAAFRASPTALLRGRVVAASTAGWALLLALTIAARWPLAAGSLLGLGLMTGLAHFLIRGFTRRDELYPEIRGLILESRGVDLLTGAAAGLLLVVALVVLHLQWAWLCLGILAAVLAFALHEFGDLKTEHERRGAVEEARALVRDLRLKGVHDEAVRGFVRSTAGDDWGPFYQAVFGESDRRAALGPADRSVKALLRHPAFALRSAAAAWVQARLESRRRERETAFFQAVEERSLVAEGVNLLTARRRSRRIAGAMVAVTSELRDAASLPPGSTGPEDGDRPSVALAVRLAAEAPEEVLVEHERGLIGREDRSRLLKRLSGPRPRFLLGSALLVGFLAWVHQNGIISGDQITDLAVKAVGSDDPIGAVRDARIDVRVPEATTPLRAPFLPRLVSNLFHGFPPGAAGLVLIVSSFFRGARVGALVLAGTLVMLLGPRVGFLHVEPFRSDASAVALGAGIAALALFFGGAEDE